MISERQISLWMAILLIILPASLHAQEQIRILTNISEDDSIFPRH
jgi:hypothetical protein